MPVPPVPGLTRAEETLVLPRLGAMPPANAPTPQSPPSPVELAAMHGLKPAGTRPHLVAYIGQLWRYRQFIFAYANGRLVAQFSKARLGQLWQVFTPLLNAGVYFLIFGVVLDTSRGMENFIGYLCTGVFIFTFTQSVVTAGVSSISGQIGLVRALHFPRAALPLATMLTQLQSLLTSLVVLGAIVWLSGDPITMSWLWLLPAVALQTMFNAGLTMLVARIGVKAPDVKQLLPYLMRTWMYASGVLYSVELFAENLPPVASQILHHNPMLIYIELARMSLLEYPTLVSTTAELWTLGAGWAVLSLVLGFWYFWRGEAEYGRG